jgi:hypothetical protein
MACMGTLAPNQTLVQRMSQVDRALKRLEAALTGGQVKVTIGTSGAVAFSGWSDRDGISDVCAYRSLAVSSSWALRQAVARAEAVSGRKVNAQAIAAGVHSHDSGRTWDKGH